MKFNCCLLLISLFFSSAHAGDEVHCQALHQLMEFKSLPLQDCKMAEALVSNEEVKAYQKEKIYNKLAKKLSTQIEQNLEEMAILDQFYTANEHDLMMDSEAIKNNCRLGHAKTLETSCPGQKLNILKSKFSTQGDSLSSKLAAKFTASRNIGKDKKQCPIQGDFGAFTLSAQLDNKSMINFINVAKNNEASADQFDAWLDQNPQFKLIVKTGNKDLKMKFKSYLTSFSGDPEKAREYVSQFFFQPDNQKILSQGLADQCGKINRNLETFLCKDLDQLGSLEEVASQELFGLDPKIDLKDMFDIPNDDSIYAAYGFQCLAREESKKANYEKKNSTDQWFNKFNENTRPTLSESQTKNVSISFCSVYQCKAPELSDAVSCKAGGPISSKDLKTTYGCPGGKECSDAILKYINFLETLEKDKTPQSSALASSGSSSSDNGQSNSSSKPARYSAFTENLLGVEGTLVAEGKTITPIAIAEKQKDFLERKLDPTPSSRDVKMDKTVAQAPITQPTMNQTVAETSAQTLTTSSSPRFDANDTISTNNAIKGVRTTKTTTSSKDYSSSTSISDRDAEIKKLRDELNSIVTNMKGTENDKLNTAIDHNSKYSPPSYGGSSKSSPYQGLNNSEKDRLDQYQKNLNAWENRLQNWQNNLAMGDTARSPAAATSDAIAKRNDSSEAAMKSARGESAIQLTSGDKGEKGKSGKASGTNPNGTSADAPEAVLSSDELANLKPEALKKLGINFKSSFLMKIRYKEKFYEIPVKSFSYRGKDILVPLLSDKNSSLAKIVLDSPLFSDYKQLQIDRQKERSAYAEALN